MTMRSTWKNILHDQDCPRCGGWRTILTFGGSLLPCPACGGSGRRSEPGEAPESDAGTTMAPEPTDAAAGLTEPEIE
jgi:hypothetical protein